MSNPPPINVSDIAWLNTLANTNDPVNPSSTKWKARTVRCTTTALCATSATVSIIFLFVKDHYLQDLMSPNASEKYSQLIQAGLLVNLGASIHALIRLNLPTIVFEKLQNVLVNFNLEEFEILWNLALEYDPGNLALQYDPTWIGALKAILTQGGYHLLGNTLTFLNLKKRSNSDVVDSALIKYKDTNTTINEKREVGLPFPIEEEEEEGDAYSSRGDSQEVAISRNYCNFEKEEEGEPDFPLAIQIQTDPIQNRLLTPAFNNNIGTAIFTAAMTASGIALLTLNLVEDEELSSIYYRLGAFLTPYMPAYDLMELIMRIWEKKEAQIDNKKKVYSDSLDKKGGIQEAWPLKRLRQLINLVHTTAAPLILAGIYFHNQPITYVFAGSMSGIVNNINKRDFMLKEIKVPETLSCEFITNKVASLAFMLSTLAYFTWGETDPTNTNQENISMNFAMVALGLSYAFAEAIDLNFSPIRERLGNNPSIFKDFLKRLLNQCLYLIYYSSVPLSVCYLILGNISKDDDRAISKDDPLQFKFAVGALITFALMLAFNRVQRSSRFKKYVFTPTFADLSTIRAGLDIATNKYPI